MIIKPRVKESRWWIHAEHFTGNAARNAFFLVEYLLMYEPLVKEMQKQHTCDLLSVDATPRKMFLWPHFAQDENLEVNYCLLPAVIPKVLPWAKFLVITRNPTDFLYSAFWYSCTVRGRDLPKDVQSKGPDIFHERVVKKINNFKICIERFPLVKCVIDSAHDTYFNHELPCGRTALHVSIYYVHVHKWLSVVPRSKDN